MKDKKILIGVMHVTREPWLSIASKGQIPTWKIQKSKNYEVLYFFSKTFYLANILETLIENLRWHKGRYYSYLISYILMFLLTPFRGYIPKTKIVNKSKSKIQAHALEINLPELTSSMRWKKVAFLDYFLKNTQSEYVIMLSSASILNVKIVEKLIEQFDAIKGPVYAGPSQPSHDCDFVSGSFTIISRSAAELLIKNLSLMPVHSMDDVAFGHAFKKLKVPIINIPNLNIASLTELNQIPGYILQSTPHFRFKSGSIKKRNDILLMRNLLTKFDLS